VCEFCVDKIEDIDYKRLDILERYLTERGKINGRRKTGTCAKHQRRLAIAVKRARYLALLPYTAGHVRTDPVVSRPVSELLEHDFLGTGQGRESVSAVEEPDVEFAPEEAPVEGEPEEDLAPEAEAEGAEPEAEMASEGEATEQEPEAVATSEDESTEDASTEEEMETV
jgi:small subunit ribosomal protein S18